MPRAKTKKEAEPQDLSEEKIVPIITDLGWTEYVLSLLSDDEKIQGNPTTDGLRRIFEIAMDCVIIESTSDVVQSPQPANEKRATVVHSLSYCLNDDSMGSII